MEGWWLRMKRNKGFTLIEMIVSVGLMMILIAIVIQAFHTADKVGRKTRAWIEIHQNARCLFDFMDRDIGGVITIPNLNTATQTLEYSHLYGWQHTYNDANSNSHQADAIIMLCRTLNPSPSASYMPGYGGTDMAEVGYCLSNSIGHQNPSFPTESTSDTRYNDLVRCTNYQSAGSRTLNDIHDGIVWADFPTADVVATGLTDLQIEFLPATISSVDLGGGWRQYTDALPPNQTNHKPSVIKITVYLVDRGGIFLSGVTDNNPFAGYGIKFEHAVIVKQE
jgi:type II secretory pathway pseudopilin PulG